MKPELKTVYLPHDNSISQDKTIISIGNNCNVQASERYVFTREELNTYVSDIIKQALDIAAREAEIVSTPYSRWCSECGTSEDQILTKKHLINLKYDSKRIFRS